MALVENRDGFVSHAGSYYHFINGVKYTVIFNYVKCTRSQSPSMRERCPVLDNVRSMADAIEVFASIAQKEDIMV